MMNVRVIPCLLLRGAGFVKTIRFGEPTYLGDPINIVKIFNDKEVDEIGILDIGATAERRPPAFDLLKSIADNCFIPLSYGGGITGMEDIRRILGIGYEKVIIGSRAVEQPALVEEAARVVGSQSVVISIDARRGLFGKYEVCIHGGTRGTKMDPAAFARQMEQAGAGEILLTSIDRDGSMSGYDIELIRMVSGAVGIPVIASGGASKIQDFVDAVRKGGASAVAAASFFVFHGRRRAVLINFPDREELEAALQG